MLMFDGTVLCQIFSLLRTEFVRARFCLGFFTVFTPMIFLPFLEEKELAAVFMGIFSYSDDNLLVAPSKTPARNKLQNKT